MKWNMLPGGKACFIMGFINMVLFNQIIPNSHIWIEIFIV